jgi:hypothetical protein
MSSASTPHQRIHRPAPVKVFHPDEPLRPLRLRLGPNVMSGRVVARSIIPYESYAETGRAAERPSPTIAHLDAESKMISLEMGHAEPRREVLFGERNRGGNTTPARKMIEASSVCEGKTRSLTLGAPIAFVDRVIRPSKELGVFAGSGMRGGRRFSGLPGAVRCPPGASSPAAQCPPAGPRPGAGGR